MKFYYPVIDRKPKIIQVFGNFNPQLYKLIPGSPDFTGRHHGTDWRTSSPEYPMGIGIPIYCMKEGDVYFVDSKGEGLYGKHVRVDYGVLEDGLRHIGIYAHLSKVNVTKGQKVDVWTVLGRSGNTGKSTGGHLHSENRKGDFDSPFKLNKLRYAYDVAPFLVDRKEFTTFPDVPKLHPHYADIEELAKRGVVNGYDNGNFGPDDRLTRGQLCTILMNMERAKNK